MQRKCKKCGYLKVITAFPISDAKRGYRRHECRTCYKARMKSYYAKAPDAYKARAKTKWEAWGSKAYIDLRDEILGILGASCQCCGEDNPLFLAIDHVDNDGAEWRRSHGQGLRGLRAIRKQIDTGETRFQVLCHNCNTGKKLNGGICHHKGTFNDYPQGE